MEREGAGFIRSGRFVIIGRTPAAVIPPWPRRPAPGRPPRSLDAMNGIAQRTCLRVPFFLVAFFYAAVFFMAMAMHSAVAAGPDDDGRRLFETRIQPVLVQRCYKCHSSTAKKLQGGLHLDSANGLR